MLLMCTVFYTTFKVTNLLNIGRVLLNLLLGINITNFV